MGGEGSGNTGRRKFGNKFYEMEAGYKTREQAENNASRLEAIGVKTKVVQGIYELPWYPHDEVKGYLLYYIPTYVRPSRSKKSRRKDGTRPRF